MAKTRRQTETIEEIMDFLCDPGPIETESPIKKDTQKKDFYPDNFQPLVSRFWLFLSAACGAAATALTLGLLR